MKEREAVRSAVTGKVIKMKVKKTSKDKEVSGWSQVTTNSNH